MAAADPARLRKLTRQLSIGGLMAALILILIAAKFIIPTGNLAMLAVASLCVAIAVIEIGFKPAILVYLAAALLSLAWPGLAAAFPFIAVFGPYPLVRALIDKLFGRKPAIFLKLLAGNILVGLAALFFAWQEVITLAGSDTFFWLLAPIALQAVLIIYDYALGLMIQFYMVRIRKQ